TRPRRAVRILLRHALRPFTRDVAPRRCRGPGGPGGRSGPARGAPARSPFTIGSRPRPAPRAPGAGARRPLGAASGGRARGAAAADMAPDRRSGADRAAGARRRHRAPAADRPRGPSRLPRQAGKPPRPPELLGAVAVLRAVRRARMGPPGGGRVAQLG